MSGFVSSFLSIAAIIIPILYSIFFEGVIYLKRRKNNFIIDLMNQIETSINLKFYLLFGLCVFAPLLILSWFDYLHLDSSLADFYLPSIAVIITGLLITIFKRIWVLFISSIGVFLLFHTYYIFHRYWCSFYAIYAISLLVYIFYMVYFYKNKFQKVPKKILNLQWTVEVISFSAFTFQLIYSVFVMGLDSLPVGNEVASNLSLGNLYIIFISSWSLLLALSLAFGLKWAMTSAKINIFSSMLKFKQTKQTKVKVGIKGFAESDMKSGQITSISNSLVIADDKAEVSIIPWEEICMISYTAGYEHQKKKR